MMDFTQFFLNNVFSPYKINWRMLGANAFFKMFDINSITSLTRKDVIWIITCNAGAQPDFMAILILMPAF